MIPHPNLQILRAVIQTITVPVVHSLASAEFATKRLLHDQAMLKMTLTLDPDPPIAAGINMPGSLLSDLERQRVTVLPEALVVLGAVAPTHSHACASIHLADESRAVRSAHMG
jgi:hypothetical protein